MEKQAKQKPTSISKNLLSRQNIVGESVEYTMFSYDSTDVYIWSSQSLIPTIISLDESFLDDTSKQIEDCREKKEEEIVQLTEEKPMNERNKGSTDEELEGLAKDNLKILLETFEANMISNRIEDQLDIDGNDPEEEDKSTDRFAEPLRCQYATSQKSHVNQTNEEIEYWSGCQIHETLLTRKKWQHLNKDDALYYPYIGESPRWEKADKETI